MPAGTVPARAALALGLAGVVLVLAAAAAAARRRAPAADGAVFCDAGGVLSRGPRAGMSPRLLHAAPPVAAFDDFLDGATCRRLIALAEPRFERSHVEGRAHAERTVSDERTSDSAMLHEPPASTDPAVLATLERAARLLDAPVSHLEPLQVVRYRPGQRFGVHHDSFADVRLGEGQRVATLFVYLNDAQPEAATEFPRLGLAVSPRAGTAVYWCNLRADGAIDDRAQHAGRAPRGGVKYGLNVWLREKPYGR